MLFSSPFRLCYTAIRPFCDRVAGNNKEELGILVVGVKWSGGHVVKWSGGQVILQVCW